MRRKLPGPVIMAWTALVVILVLVVTWGSVALVRWLTGLF